MSATHTERLPTLQRLAHRDRRRSLADDDVVAHGKYLMLDDEREARLLPLDADAVRIGRGVMVDITIEESTVSRRHATILRVGAVMLLHDDCSTNGTYVNGRRVTCVELVDGDVLCFGRATVIFRDTTPVTTLQAV